jgi:ABC-2 type transport system permease protein
MVLSTPTSPLDFIFLTSLYPVARAAFDAGIYLFCGVLLGMPLSSANFPAAILVFLLSELAFGSIGILAATFTLVFKRGDPILWLFGGLSWLIGGVFYPVDVLPRILRIAAQLLPVTHALEGMRAALLRHASIHALLPQIEALGLFTLVSLPVSLAAFLWAIRWAKTTGTLSHF